MMCPVSSVLSFYLCHTTERCPQVATLIVGPGKPLFPSLGVLFFWSEIPITTLAADPKRAFDVGDWNVGQSEARDIQVQQWTACTLNLANRFQINCDRYKGRSSPISPLVFSHWRLQLTTISNVFRARN